MAEQIAIVTGATHGIGRALAVELRDRGFAVHGTGRDVAALRDLERVGIHGVALDVTDEAARDRFAAGFDSVSLLINNAGYGLMGPVVELPPEQLRHQFEVNTFAPIALAGALLPALVATGGTVVNVTSVSGVLTTPFAGAYCASKAALNSLTEALRVELAPFGVQVLALQPGHIASDFGSTAGRLAERDWAQSRYAPVREAIAQRAQASQHRATPAAEFAREALDHVLSSRPRPVATFGRGGRPLVVLGRYVPARWRDRLLARRFRLQALAGTAAEAR